MDGSGDYADLLCWAQRNGINASGSFLSSVDAGTLSRSPSTSTILSPNNNDAIAAVSQSADRAWNVASVVCGDGSSGLLDGVFYGSGSIDGSVSTFWALEWDSLRLSWRFPDISGIISWPCRAVTQIARSSRAKGLVPFRPYVDITGYPETVAADHLKESQHS